MKLRLNSILFSSVSLGLLLIASVSVAQSSSDIPGAKDWFAAGMTPQYYKMGVTMDQHHTGKSAAYISSVNSHSGDWATMMQSCKVGQYKGRRVEMSGWIKSQDVKGGAALWLRVDGETKKTLALDNMHNRQIKGTTDWTEYTITMNVSDEASELSYGVSLEGEGTVYFDDISFKDLGEGRSELRSPSNLDFEAR